MLHGFNVTAAALLGQGGESEVYALDGGRVLRVYKHGAPVAYLERRRAFYALLRERRPPFEVPDVLEAGTAGDRYYTVERRMAGRDFAAVLPGLEGAERERALASYLHIAGQIGALSFPERPFGEILAPGEPLQRDSWPAYLWDRLQRTLAHSRPDLEQDVPRLEALLAHVRYELRALEGFAERRLVHGDYFPGNVYIDDDLRVCGVGDFGYTTVVGDPRMDLAGAVVFLEVVDGYRPEDTPFLVRLLAEQHGPGIAPWVALYRLYYALYFSGCKLDDPYTYAWCVRSLQAQVIGDRS
ncbi:MAG TPA: aminoglycoside phosphotransferase family protein [Roseiflexaceae bacterium]|nr:aminoglycoside phosphotransferase family protein [Roseiflexaceae bacterium]